jgi:molybdate transport system substrate-binding protein
MTKHVPVRLCTSNSTYALLQALAEAYERRSGQPVAIACDSAKVMMARIRDGDAGDLVILGAETVGELARDGLVDAASVRPFARSRVGIAVRAGAAKPDIGTVESFKRTLLDAKSIAHTVHGASGMYFPKLVERLGIAAAVLPKTVTRPGGLIGKVVAAGEAELAFQQVPELLAVPGIDIVGVIPEAVGKVFETAAGIFARSTQRGAAQALLDDLLSPSSRALYAEKGLEPAA